MEKEAPGAENSQTFRGASSFAEVDCTVAAVSVEGRDADSIEVIAAPAKRTKNDNLLGENILRDETRCATPARVHRPSRTRPATQPPFLVDEASMPDCNALRHTAV